MYFLLQIVVERTITIIRNIYVYDSIEKLTFDHMMFEYNKKPIGNVNH